MHCDFVQQCLDLLPSDICIKVKLIGPVCLSNNSEPILTKLKSSDFSAQLKISNVKEAHTYLAIWYF